VKLVQWLKEISAQVYPGCVVLFRASEKALRGLDDPQEGWRQYAAGRIEVREIDGITVTF